jgi:SAM-dependent methyltransferase
MLANRPTGVVRPPLISDARTAAPAELIARPHARIVGLESILHLLQSPDRDEPLTMDMDARVLADSRHIYPMNGTLPLLIPVRLQSYFTDRLAVPITHSREEFLQYFLLASIKQSGEINAAPDDVHFQRHLFRMKTFVKDCEGLVLDVGCDDPATSAALFPPTSEYVGLDPFCLRSEPFRLIGLGEFLPFRDASVANVVFNTSLDHILDWHRAIAEARRVLRPGGRLYIATLIWESCAELMNDSVHFHHFRLSELLAGLSGFSVESSVAYDYKGNVHRYGLYLAARKISDSATHEIN